jgi:hypothetical protein
MDERGVWVVGNKGKENSRIGTKLGGGMEKPITKE